MAFAVGDICPAQLLLQLQSVQHSPASSFPYVLFLHQLSCASALVLVKVTETFSSPVKPTLSTSHSENQFKNMQGLVILQPGTDTGPPGSIRPGRALAEPKCVFTF